MIAERAKAYIFYVEFELVVRFSQSFVNRLVFIAILAYRVHAGKLGQVTNFTIVGGTAKHCVDQYMILFRNCSLGGNTLMTDGLHARLCHAFLVNERR